MNNSPPEEEPTIKSICTQIIVSLYSIDNELLEQGVNKLDFTKKTPIRKVMIEHENMTSKHKNLQVNTIAKESLTHQGPTHGPNFIADAADRDGSPQASLRDTQQSFASFHRSNQGEPESPSPNINGNIQLGRRGNRDFGQNSTGMSFNRQSSEVRSSRRTAHGDLGGGGFDRQDSMRITGQSWADKRAAQLAEQTNSSMLPDIGGHRRKP